MAFIFGREQAVAAWPDPGEQLPGAAAEQHGAGVEHLAEAELLAGTFQGRSGTPIRCARIPRSRPDRA